MRAWPHILFSLLLGAPLAASIPLPAAAKSFTHQVVVSSNGTVRFVSHPFVSPFFPLTNGVLFPNGTIVRSRFGQFSPGVAGGFFSPLTGWGWDGPPPDESPRIVVLNAGSPPALPARPEVSDRPSVETTPSGVQIVRGPGSHHLSRY